MYRLLLEGTPSYSFEISLSILKDMYYSLTFFFLITFVHIQRFVCMIDRSILNFFTCHSITMTYNKWLLYVIFDVLYLTLFCRYRYCFFIIFFFLYFDYLIFHRKANQLLSEESHRLRSFSQIHA